MVSEILRVCSVIIKMIKMKMKEKRRVGKERKGVRARMKKRSERKYIGNRKTAKMIY